jgi:alpha-tubulin suppressor-like RCC1 family protein
VRAVSSAGSSKAVKTKPVTPAPTAPDPPATVTAASAQPGQIAVNWQPPASDGGLPITRYTITALPGSQSVTAAASATGATIAGLDPNETYAVRVAAHNALGASSTAEARGIPAEAGVTSSTVVLSGEALAALDSVSSSGELAFENAPAQVAGLTPGKVIAAGVSTATPDGLLARVVSVSSSGTETRVATTPAALDEALKSGGLAGASEEASEQVAAFHAARPGIRLVRPASGHGLALSIGSDLYRDSAGQSVTVTGSASFTPRVSFNAGVQCCIHTYSHFEGTLTAASSLQLSAAVSHTFSTGYPLGTVTFDPIPIDVLGVPFVLVPSLEIKLVASGNATAGVTAAARQSTTLGVKLDTSGGSVSASPIYRVSAGYTPPTLDGSATFKAGVQGTLKVAIDDLAGPYLTDTLYGLELHVDPAASPWWTLSLENQLSAGINVALLHRTFADWSAGSLLDAIVPLAHATGPFEQITVTPARPRIAPGETVQLSGATGGVPTGNLAWSVSSGQGNVSAAGLYTAPTAPGNYRVTAITPGTGLQPPGFGSADVEVGTQPSDTPGEVTATATTSTSARISWQPPSSGSPISSYTVTASPGGAQAKGASGPVIVPELTPGQSYTFTVTAKTGSQNSLPSAPSNPVTMPEAGESAENGVWGWGLDDDYQLGNRSESTALTPIHDLGLGAVVSIATGATIFPNSRETTGYALEPDGTVRAWGYNYFGAVGDGERSEEPVSTPKAVVGLNAVKSIAAYGAAALALKSDGTVWAWGLNTGGIFGDGGKASLSASPVQVPGLTDVVAIAAGERTGYALRSDGTVWAWGYGGYGEIGDGEIHEESVLPKQIPGLSGITAIGAGSDFALAVRSDETVVAWGGNVNGTLGNGSTANNSLEPVQVSGLTSVTEVAGDSADGYALKSDGTVRAWGLGQTGELGNGTFQEVSRTPVQVTGLTNVSEIAAGDEAGHALLADGTVWSWGNGGIYDYLGSGSTYSSDVPVEASGLTGATAIAATSGNAFAVVRR